MKKPSLTLLLCCFALLSFTQTNLDSLRAVWNKYPFLAKSSEYKYLDSLRVVWNNTSQADTCRLKAMSGIVKSYANQLDSALYFSQQQYDLAESKGNRKWMANALNLIGIIYNRQGDNAQAIDYYSRSLKIREKIGDKNGIAGSLNNIGNIYTNQGDYAQAIDYYSRSLKIEEEIGDKNGVGITLNNIGIIYDSQGDYAQAIDCYSRSLKIREEIGDKYLIATSLNNIGVTYKNQGDYAQAIDYCSRSLKIREEVGDKYSIAFSLDNIGNIYSDQGDYTQAIDYFTRSLKISEEIEDKPGIATSLDNLGEPYLRQGNYSKAISYGSRSLTLAREVGNVAVIESAAEHLHESYKATSQYRKALEMQTLYFQMRDSIESEENQKAVMQQQFQYDYEKKGLADSLAQVEKNLVMEMAFQKEIFKKDKARNILLALGLIALLLSGGFWSRNRYVRKTNRQLAIAKEQAERSEKYKQQFLANMSHEIRTPMHAISGMVKILKRNEHLPTQKTFLNAMHTSSDNLVVILNDVLDLSKIEAGKLDIENIPMSPTAVIENVTQILKYKAEEKGLQLNYHIEEEVPDLIMGDPTRLNQVLINLAGNAIKFTEKGSVDLFLKKENDQLRFIIKDTGIGIPKEKAETIFGAFEQAKDSTSRHYGGTGLGLSISKQLVELQQGKIWVESEDGQGSTFYFEIPLVIAAADAMSQDIITEDKLKMMASSLEGIRILLAEDNAFNQMIAQDDLSFYIEGVKIDLAENGALAVEKFNSGNYDLILMDVQMPEMNGFEATQKIREREKLEKRVVKIPIIAMTASLLKSEINNCYKAGMDDYIPKPYSPEELIGPIFNAIQA
jgi:signal transduction histidine kinase/ActR/RegA family two-component response regulator/predicted negative regulator of RcsB-dependent stress response